MAKKIESEVDVEVCGETAHRRRELTRLAREGVRTVRIVRTAEGFFAAVQREPAKQNAPARTVALIYGPFRLRIEAEKAAKDKLRQTPPVRTLKAG